MRDRRGSDGGHILIGGTGRAGTTLLVQYFTALGFDTGYSLDQAQDAVNSIAQAGLEHSFGATLEQGKRLPYVAKSPWFGLRLAEFLDSESLRLVAFIVPMRELKDAAASRQRVTRMVEQAGVDPTGHPGGLTRAGLTTARQEKTLAVKFHDLVWILVDHGIDAHFLPFPTFVNDPGLLFSRLADVLEPHGVTRAESDAAFMKVVDPSLVHTFGTD